MQPNNNKKNDYKKHLKIVNLKVTLECSAEKMAKDTR